MVRSFLPLLALAAGLAMPGPASAQFLRTHLTGLVERAPANPCDPTATHRVGCTQVLLRSSAVNLESLVGRIALMEGDVTGTPACPVLDVDEAAAAAFRTTAFALGGFRPGNTVILTTFAPVGSAVVLLFAFNGPGFVPLGPYGSWLLDPLSTFYWSVDVSIGVAVRSLPIPNDPALVNQTAHMQTAWVSAAPAFDLSTLNPNCITILPR